MAFGKIFRALRNPIKAITGSSLLSKIFNPHSFIKGLLTPKTPKLGTQSGEQVVSIEAQNNSAKLSEPKAVLYGLNYNYYPALIQQPWSEFVNNTQILHLRMHVTVGIATLQALSIGKTPLTSFPGSVFELLAPGQAMTLFHPNVYVAEQLDGLELIVGILVTRTYTGEIVFDGARLMVPDDATSVAARAAAGVNPFFGAAPGNNVVVSGTALNDGIYDITAVDPTAPVDYLDTTATFTAETITASISYGSYVEGGTQYPSIAGVTVTYDAALSTISAAPLGGNETPLDIFLPSDVMTTTLSAAGANRYEPFTVLAADVDGALIVDPPPTSLGPVVVNAALLRRYFGPFPACPPGDTVDRVAVDLLWPQGIGSRGGTRDITMRFDAQYQPIDDAGTPTAGWLSFPTIEVTARSRNPYRRSFEFEVDPPARLQVRLAQVSIDSSNAEIIDTVQWAALRGYVVARPGETPAIDADSTTLAVSLRASNTLASGDDQKINGTFQRWLETWSPETGWGPEVPTRSPAWAALDKLRGRYTAAGRAVPDAEIDLAGFAALNTVLAARGDAFDGQISVAGNLLDNVNTILQLGRAQVDYRWQDGKISVYRDADTAPVLMFTDMNSGLSGYQVQLRTDNDATGVQVSYIEPAFGDEGIIGIGDTDAKPIKLDLRNGCTSRQRAWEAANFSWNVERYRNRTFRLTAELEPLTLRVGNRILVQCRERNWGQSAEVVSRTGRSLIVWPPLVWQPSGNTLRLRGPDGAPGAVIACTRDGADNRVLLAADPDVAITGDDTGEQCTLLAFFNNGESPRTAIVTDVSWSEGSGPAQRATVSCTIDDPRVHADPGPAPVDPIAPVIALPSLVVSGLEAVDNTDGTVSASWDAVASASLYELGWRYVGDLGWTTARRGVGTSTLFTVPASGTIEIRVRAFGGGLIGGYTVITLTIWIMTGGGAGAALSASSSPAGLFPSTTGTSCISGVASVAASGGTPPYAVLWQVFSDVTGGISITSATSASTTFSASALSTGEVRETTFRPRVTDALGAIAYGGTTRVVATQYSGGGTPGGGGGMLP